MTDPIEPSWTWSSKNSFTDATKDKLSDHDYNVIFQQPFSANMAHADALYKGQKNVTQEMIFHSLEAYVDDTVTGEYYTWTEQDLGPDRYVQITGISFDFWGDDIITEFPVDIPEDADTIVICVSYRLSLDDEEWTPVKGEFWGFERPGVSYTLLTGRTVVLGEKLESEGRLLPRRTSSIVEISTLKIILGVLNLMAYQQGIFRQGEQGAHQAVPRLEGEWRAGILHVSHNGGASCTGARPACAAEARTIRWSWRATG